MRSQLVAIILSTSLLLVWLVSADVDHIPCNNQRCQSRVSFCLLTKDCMCEDFESNLTCASLCTKCLNDTYQDCCSCVGLCKASVKEADITKLSNVELLPEPDTEVFTLISQAPGKREDWHFLTRVFKLHLDLPNYDQIPSLASNESQYTEFNCTIVYLAQCMAMNKCKQNCNSMGASAFRWFHNACCECIGECDMAPYGDEEAKCEYCTGTDKQEVTETSVDKETGEDEAWQGDDSNVKEEEHMGDDY